MERPERLHHAAYLTYDTAATVRWYTEVLGMKFVGYAAGDHVPSTGASDRFFHSFLEMEDGSCIAFFEIEGLDKKADETIVPRWVRHIALKVPSEEALAGYKARLESHGIDVVGVTDHDFCKSIYFFDPNGIRLELTADVRPFSAEDAQAAAKALGEWNRSTAATVVG